ncbi:MAG: hypothetical protein KAV87_63105 [Desulfobacteraceae bacterium]|nr:hypothetical protein [Desulfobacteraceae bacterium]
MKKIKKWISHNQGIFVSVLICVAVSIYIFGCQSKVTSLLSDDRLVTVDELEVEFEDEAARIELALESLIKRAEVKFKEIERQDAIKQKLMDAALISTKAGALNPAGLVGLLIGVVGIGAGIDNRIKDKIIKNRPLPKKEV